MVIIIIIIIIILIIIINRLWAKEWAQWSWGYLSDKGKSFPFKVFVRVLQLFKSCGEDRQAAPKYRWRVTTQQLGRTKDSTTLFFVKSKPVLRPIILRVLGMKRPWREAPCNVEDKMYIGLCDLRRNKLIFTIAGTWIGEWRNLLDIEIVFSNTVFGYWLKYLRERSTKHSLI